MRRISVATQSETKEPQTKYKLAVLFSAVGLLVICAVVGSSMFNASASSKQLALLNFIDANFTDEIINPVSNDTNDSGNSSTTGNQTDIPGGIFFATNSSPSINQWSTLNSMPVLIGEVTTAVIGNNLYVVGQGDSGTYVYNISSGVWSKVSSRPKVGNHHASVVWNGLWILIGGLSSSGKVQIYNPVTDQWRYGADMPWAGGSVAAGLVGDRIYAAGGLVNGVTVGTAGYYTPSLSGPGSWTLIPSMPYPVNHASGGSDGNRLFVFSGRSGPNKPSEAFTFYQIYDPSTQSWTLSPNGSMPNSHGGAGAAVYIDGEFYIMGGEYPKVKTALDIYNVEKNTWRKGADMPQGRHGIYPTASADGAIYVAGGGIKQGNSQCNILTRYLP